MRSGYCVPRWRLLVQELKKMTYVIPLPTCIRVPFSEFDSLPIDSKMTLNAIQNTPMYKKGHEAFNKHPYSVCYDQELMVADIS